MNSTLQIALMRGILIAIISAGTAFFTTLATVETATVEEAAIVAGAAFFAALGMRFGAEGAYDSGSTIQRTADVAKTE